MEEAGYHWDWSKALTVSSMKAGAMCYSSLSPPVPITVPGKWWMPDDC